MIPCKKCLIIPICRQKVFMRLVHECSILKDQLYFSSEVTIPYYRKNTFNYNIIELDYLFKQNYRDALLNHSERLTANKKYLKARKQ
jgi:hypothetical protein